MYGSTHIKDVIKKNDFKVLGELELIVDNRNKIKTVLDIQATVSDSIKKLIKHYTSGCYGFVYCSDTSKTEYDPMSDSYQHLMENSLYFVVLGK